jgi:rod shape determining protein RodA
MDPANPPSARGHQLTQLQRRAHLDGPLLFLLALLCGLGLVVLYSAADNSLDAVHKQGIRLLVAAAGMVIVAQVPPQTMRILAPWGFAAGLIALALVPFIGLSAGGAQRWIELGPIQFQPSELMKVAVPVAISAYLAGRPLPPRLPDLLASLCLIGIPVALIGIQPDLGTAVLVAATGFFVVFLAGLPWRYIIGAGLAALPAIAGFWHYGMRDYQKERVLTFLNPEREPLGAGYHIIQSKIAIGSGGLYGKGWLNGTQSHLDFLPERQTDFVFAVLAEELGLIGVAGLVMVYFIIVARGLWIASQAQDDFGRLLAGTLSLTFFVYCFVNIGMVSGLLPVVGLPLPMISYGGTSVVTLMAGFGILMSIHTHRRTWAG